MIQQTWMEVNRLNGEGAGCLTQPPCYTMTLCCVFLQYTERQSLELLDLVRLKETHRSHFIQDPSAQQRQELELFLRRLRHEIHDQRW